MEGVGMKNSSAREERTFVGRKCLSANITHGFESGAFTRDLGLNPLHLLKLGLALLLHRPRLECICLRAFDFRPVRVEEGDRRNSWVA